MPSCAVDRSVVGMRKLGWYGAVGFQTFEGASVLVFAPGNTAAAESLFNRLSQTISAEAIRKNGLLLARPRATVIVVATSKAYLREVLSRMKEFIDKSPMASVAREGFSRSAGSRQWAYRAFDRGVPTDDPFSPRGPDPRGGPLDPEAKSVFVISPAGDQAGLDVEYSSGSLDALKRIQDRWTLFHSEAPPTVENSEPARIRLHFAISPRGQDLADSLDCYFGMGVHQ